MALERLDKLIADSGAAARSDAKRLIRSGAVTVDGSAVTDCGAKLDAQEHTILCSGRAVTGLAARTFMMNKPAGVLSATEDREQSTVIDLLPQELKRLGLFPAGRLDKDTTGLLLLTNDGELAHRVTSPRHEVRKRYELTTEGELGERDVLSLAAGIELRDGTICRPAKLEIDDAEPSHAFITISEGKYHQVKRMLAALGKPVLTLKRCAEGALLLDGSLAPGEVRELTREELDMLFTE